MSMLAGPAYYKAKWYVTINPATKLYLRMGEHICHRLMFESNEQSTDPFSWSQYKLLYIIFHPIKSVVYVIASE